MFDADAIAAVREVAAGLGIPPEWLAGVIDFESAGTWSATVRNPGSSAAGLIQFTDATARDLGYSSSVDLVAQNPTTGGQLRGPVYQYLVRWAPFATLQSLAMAVFYPAARGWNPSQEFPAWVEAANPGIRTVEDYLSAVEQRVARLAGAVGSSISSVLSTLTGGSGTASTVLLVLAGTLALLLVMRSLDG